MPMRLGALRNGPTDYGARNSPGKRWLHSAVYDAVNNRMIVYAGGSGGPYAFPEFNDVWVLANANGLSGTPAWTRIKPAGAIPAPRGGHSAIYDPATNRMLVFAGDVLRPCSLLCGP